jgi:hypothetical protein
VLSIAPLRNLHLGDGLEIHRSPFGGSIHNASSRVGSLKNVA